MLPGIRLPAEPDSNMERSMKKTVGLWIDRRKAVIVAVSEKGEETKVIDSNVEKQPGRFAGVRSTTPYESQLVPADDSRERKFTGHLHSYYDEVISAVFDAESILIFGPGEAKGELKKCLERNKIGGQIVTMETVDAMTDRQVAAKVREYFKKTSRMGKNNLDGLFSEQGGSHAHYLLH